MNDTLFMTGNGVGPCTLLTRYRLARGIRFLLVGTLSVGGVASLIAIGKEHVSHKHNLFLLRSSITYVVEDVKSFFPMDFVLSWLMLRA
jgi:hypothetical protein